MKTDKVNKLFNEPLVVINMGVDIFAENLQKAKVRVLKMNWKPPAGGNKRLLSLLERLGR